MKIILALSLFISLSASAQTFMLESGSATYEVSHMIKKVEGQSSDLKGKMVCKDSLCDYLIAMKVDSFKSSDSNRDLNMLTILDSEKFPLITVKGKVALADLKAGNSKVKSLINFHGVEKEYDINLSGLETGEGSLDLDLEAHAVERPSLLTVKIKNSVPVKFSYKWK